MLKGVETAETRKEQLDEFNTMQALGTHQNIVSVQAVASYQLFMYKLISYVKRLDIPFLYSLVICIMELFIGVLQWNMRQEALFKT